MLTELVVRNFTIVQNLELELEAGLTVITGETGAGKSIMLDARHSKIGNNRCLELEIQPCSMPVN